MDSPETAWIEGIPVTGFPEPYRFFQRLLQEIRKPDQTVLYYLNVHVANEAHENPRLKKILQQGDVVYCDGAGVLLASNLLGQPLPSRLTAADWFEDLLGFLAEKDCGVFLLGGEPGIAEKALQTIAQRLPQHTVVGVHHGYILKDEALEAAVIAQINAARPDLLIVGFGTPLQELWIERHRQNLQVPAIYAIGATMDYVAGKIPRCPPWMGQAGLEWLYRLCIEPQRLFRRYVVGNPQFLWRILCHVARQNLPFQRPKRPFALR